MFATAVLRRDMIIYIISRAGYRDHTNPLFKQTGILPLDNLIKYSNLKFMHKFTHNKLPFSFSETWITNRVRNPNLELRNVDDLYTFHPTTSLQQNVFPCFHSLEFGMRNLILSLIRHLEPT
jgi:hypothetical protein